MKKFDSVKIASIEVKENKKSYYNLLIKFVSYCEQNEYKIGSQVNLNYFNKSNKIGFVKSKVFMAILFLRGYVRSGKLLQNTSTLRDNIEFKKNKIAYLFSRLINKKKH